MKITFDSNVWRKIATPDNFPKDPIIEDYKKIRKAIDDGSIEAFLSESIFTLEAIKRKDRKKFIKGYKAKMDTTVTEVNGSIKISFSMAPNREAHPGNNEFLKEHLLDAVNLGFKIICLPRIGGITNQEIEDLRYNMEESDLNRGFEAARRIKELKSGVFDIQTIGYKYNPDAWFKGIGEAPDSEDGNIAAAVAEWADGDSVAAHIAINGEYFCTNDNAKKAGSKSVLSEKNIEVLTTEYDFKKISPSELSKLLI